MNMKKIILSIIIIFFTYKVSYTQCNPIPFPAPEILSPSPAQELHPVVAEYMYQQLISVRVPLDTTISGFPVPIDSSGIVSITGLPNGLSYVTNSATDFWASNSFGCILIQGTVSQSDTGIYPVTINAVVHAMGNAFPLSYDYNLIVLDSINQGFELIDPNKFQLAQNSPNPVVNTTNIEFFSPNLSQYQFEVFDMLGNKVSETIIKAKIGVNKISYNRNNLISGIYFYRISNGEFSGIRKMIIN